MPGSGHLLSGQTVYVKLRGSKTIEGLCVRDKEGRILGGMKMANGTNSQRAPPFPGTRSKSAALMRAELIRAGEYRDKLAEALKDPEKKPPRDLRMEGLVEVLEIFLFSPMLQPTYHFSELSAPVTYMIETYHLMASKFHYSCQ